MVPHKNVEIVYPIEVKMFMECLLMRFFMLAWGSLRAKIANARWAELWSRQIVSKKATMGPKPFWSSNLVPSFLLQVIFNDIGALKLHENQNLTAGYHRFRHIKRDHWQKHPPFNSQQSFYNYRSAIFDLLCEIGLVAISWTKLVKPNKSSQFGFIDEIFSCIWPSRKWKSWNIWAFEIWMRLQKSFWSHCARQATP